MKVFVILVSLHLMAETGVSAENWLTERRERSELNANDVLAVAEVTGKFTDFHKLLDDNYNARNDDRQTRHRGGTGSSRSVAEDASYARGRLAGLGCDGFVSLSYAYFARLMIEYYAAARRHVRDCDAYDADEDRRNHVRRLIGLRDDRGFCVLAAFHDCGMAVVGAVLESLFFFRPRFPDDNGRFYPKTYVERKFREYQRVYESHFESPETSYLWPARDVTIFEHSARRLRHVKTAIVRFSDAFCQRWRPFVGQFFLSGTAAAGYSSPLIRHLFERETCDHQLADDSWSCDSILKEDHEYGFEKYKEDVSESFLEMKRNLSQKNNMVLMKQLGKRKYPMFINTSVRFPFSLAKLRDKFNEEFPSYKNAVNYYDIASKAVLLVSIREGGKILKGITHEVTRNCAETGGDINLQTVRGLRSWLSAFKSTFDRLVGLMRTEKRINFADDPHRKAFDDRVDAMLTLIDVRDRFRTDDAESKVKICGGIPRQIDGTAYEAHVGDNEYKVLKFEDYYFLAPIRHIQQLYRFYAFDFL